MVVKYYTNNSSNLLGGTLIYVCHQRTYTNTIIEHNTFSCYFLKKKYFNTNMFFYLFLFNLKKRLAEI